MKKIKISMNQIMLMLMFFISISVFSQKVTLTDPEVASVAVVANQIDVSYAEIALYKSKNKDVIAFAKRMVADHNAVIKQAVALVTKLNVTPKDNAISQSLLAEAKKTKKMLHKTKRKKFNKVYIDNEVAYHKAVISAVKELLIPESDNAELKGLLEAVLPALEAHLEHAETVQAKLCK
jgi:putative membrane protein